MPDKGFINRMESQFLEYPNGDHDDIIDCISQGVEMFKKTKLGMEEEKPKEPRTYIDPRTGQRKVVGEHNVLTLNNINNGRSNQKGIS